MKRDVSIDLLKFLAVVFVVNSHLDICYPEGYKFLATGGSLGDALFFFCSGFTLFLGRDDGFGCWYKRRMSRILPSVFVCAFAYAWWMGKDWYNAVGGWWFIRCILLYYVVLFAVRRYSMRCLWLPFALTGLVVCVWWFAVEDPRHSIYGGGYFMWSYYFIPMMLGAVVGLNREKMRVRPFGDSMGFCGSVALYYVLWKYALGHAGLEWLQLASIPFLSLSMLFLYRLANAPVSLRFMSGAGGVVMAAIGGLCLEVYLSHLMVLTDCWNAYFPFNLMLMFVGVLFTAYFVRCLSRLLREICSESPGFDWGKIFRLK